MLTRAKIVGCTLSFENVLFSTNSTTMSKALTFKDFGFKLAVINELMYNRNVLEPRFDVYDHLKAKRNLTETEVMRTVEEEGFAIVPEAREYFESLEITAEMVEDIEELITDGGDEVYMQTYPYWNGEDDTFNVKSAEDASLLPNLKKVIIFYSEDDSILHAFRERGIEADWL